VAGRGTAARCSTRSGNLRWWSSRAVGPARRTDPWRVDGISGATITSNASPGGGFLAVERCWGPYLRRFRKGVGETVSATPQFGKHERTALVARHQLSTRSACRCSASARRSP
jgi:hypothetical protein